MMEATHYMAIIPAYRVTWGEKPNERALRVEHDDLLGVVRTLVFNNEARIVIERERLI